MRSPRFSYCTRLNEIGELGNSEGAQGLCYNRQEFRQGAHACVVQVKEHLIMEIHQIAAMIEWLDEERRRDKTTIATLEQRLAQQAETANALQRRLAALESDHTVIREQALPAQKEREMLESVRKEMRQMLESSETRRLTAEREAERRGELAREGVTRTLRDQSEQIERLQKLSVSVGEQRSELSRLADSLGVAQQKVDDLNKRMEEPDRRLSFLEEQRRQDTRRIAEVETEVPELKKQIDSVRPKLALLEELAVRNERRIQEVQNTDRERRDQIQQFIDSQALLIQQRDQQVAELAKRFSEHDNIMQANIERFETWSQAYREMKRIIDDFERIGDRLERRINEVAEMQRLSEERFRDEWNDWRDDDQKRWKQLTLASDEVWRNHDKEFEGYLKRLAEIESALPSLADSLKRLWNLERDRAQLYRERYQALLMEYDTGSASGAGSTSTNTNNSLNGGS